MPKSSQSLRDVVSMEQMRIVKSRAEAIWRGSWRTAGSEGIWIVWMNTAEVRSRDHPATCWGCRGSWKPCLLFQEGTTASLTWRLVPVMGAGVAKTTYLDYDRQVTTA